MRGVQLTTRDIDLLGWMNGMGFVNVNQVAARYDISTVTAYARLRKLVQRKVILHERLVHNQPGLYLVTREGAALGTLDLPPIRQVSLATYVHNQLLVDLSIALVARYGGAFIPERVLRSERAWAPVGKREHISDGILQLSDKKIAIELELTTKSKWRLQKIIHHYRRSFEFDEVWYFCGSQAVLKLIKSESAHFSELKTFLLKDWF